MLRCRKTKLADCFVELDSLGIINADSHDTAAHEDFVKNSITKRDGKYVVTLPWENITSELADNSRIF